jgi:hypothetical protein
MNIWGKIGITAIALVGGSKLFAAGKAMSVGDHLNINLKNPRIHKVDANPFGGGIEIRTEVQLQNPTKGQMQITQPYLQILSGDSVMSSTKVSGKQFTIKPLSQLKLETVSFKLDWTTIMSRLVSTNYQIPKDLSLLKKVGWMIANYKQIVAQLDLAVKYSTYANGLFYSDTKNIEV